MPTKNLTIKLTIVMVLIFTLAGCGFSRTDPQDPYEQYNRQVFRFNMAMDKAVLRPLAKGYNKAVPQYAQARVTNFFSNFNEVSTIANDILQFQVYYTLSDGSRFLVNSTLGILGLYDVASKMDLPAHDNDFGLTLATYGMKKSPYVMVPILGPSTVRDEIGTTVDYYALSSWAILGWYVSNSWYYTYPMYGLYKLNLRAALLPADKLVDEAFDPYVFIRDAYLQSRTNKIKELRNIEPNGGTNADTFVAGNETSASGTTSGDNKDTFVPAGDETSNTKDNKDTFVPAGNGTSTNSTNKDDKDTFVPAGDTNSKNTAEKTKNSDNSTDNKSSDKNSNATTKSSNITEHHKKIARTNSSKSRQHLAKNHVRKPQHHYAQKAKKPEKFAVTLPPVKSTHLD